MPAISASITARMFCHLKPVGSSARCSINPSVSASRIEARALARRSSIARSPAWMLRVIQARRIERRRSTASANRVRMTGSVASADHRSARSCTRPGSSPTSSIALVNPRIRSAPDTSLFASSRATRSSASVSSSSNAKKQILFGVEVAVERALADPRLGTDVVDGRLVISGRGHPSPCRIDQSLAPVGTRLGIDLWHRYSVLLADALVGGWGLVWGFGRDHPHRVAGLPSEPAWEPQSGQ